MSEHTDSENSRESLIEANVAPAPTPNQIISALFSRDMASIAYLLPTADQMQQRKLDDFDRDYPKVIVIEQTRFAYRLGRPGSDRDTWVSRKDVSLCNNFAPMPDECLEHRPDGRSLWYRCVRASFKPWARAKWISQTGGVK